MSPPGKTGRNLQRRIEQRLRRKASADARSAAVRAPLAYAHANAGHMPPSGASRYPASTMPLYLPPSASRQPQVHPRRATHAQPAFARQPPLHSPQPPSHPHPHQHPANSPQPPVHSHTAHTYVPPPPWNSYVNTHAAPLPRPGQPVPRQPHTAAHFMAAQSQAPQHDASHELQSKPPSAVTYGYNVGMERSLRRANFDDAIRLFVKLQAFSSSPPLLQTAAAAASSASAPHPATATPTPLLAKPSPDLRSYEIVFRAILLKLELDLPESERSPLEDLFKRIFKSFVATPFERTEHLMNYVVKCLVGFHKLQQQGGSPPPASLEMYIRRLGTFETVLPRSTLTYVLLPYVCELPESEEATRFAVRLIRLHLANFPRDRFPAGTASLAIKVLQRTKDRELARAVYTRSHRDAKSKPPGWATSRVCSAMIEFDAMDDCLREVVGTAERISERERAAFELSPEAQRAVTLMMTRRVRDAPDRATLEQLFFTMMKLGKLRVFPERDVFHAVLQKCHSLDAPSLVLQALSSFRWQRLTNPLRIAALWAAPGQASVLDFILEEAELLHAPTSRWDDYEFSLPGAEASQHNRKQKEKRREEREAGLSGEFFGVAMRLMIRHGDFRMATMLIHEMYKQKWLVKSPSYQAAYAQFCLHFLARQSSAEIDARMGALGFPEDLRAHLVALTRTLVSNDGEESAQASHEVAQDAAEVQTASALETELSASKVAAVGTDEDATSETHPLLQGASAAAPLRSSHSKVATSSAAKAPLDSVSSENIQLSTAAQPHPTSSSTKALGTKKASTSTSPRRRSDQSISTPATSSASVFPATPNTLFDFDMTELTPRERKLLIDSAGVLGRQRGRRTRRDSSDDAWLHGEPGLQNETRGARWTRSRARFFDSVIDSWVVSGPKDDESSGMKQRSSSR